MPSSRRDQHGASTRSINSPSFCSAEHNHTVVYISVYVRVCGCLSSLRKVTPKNKELGGTLCEQRRTLWWQCVGTKMVCRTRGEMLSSSQGLYIYIYIYIVLIKSMDQGMLWAALLELTNTDTLKAREKYIHWYISTKCMFVLRHSVTCCVADEIQRFMEEVKSLSYEDKPPYEKLRSILKAGLKAVQAKDDGKLEFTPVNGAVPPPAKVSTHTHTHTHTHLFKRSSTTAAISSYNQRDEPTQSFQWICSSSSKQLIDIRFFSVYDCRPGCSVLLRQWFHYHHSRASYLKVYL